MKKKNIINLIRYYVEKKDQSFRNEAYEIARSFDKMGDSQLAEYIMALLSGANTFEPQQSEEKNLEFLEKIILTRDSLHIPEVIVQDILGAVQAVKRRIGIHKFLFKGAPGTGKTEATKQFARILDREVYMVDFTSLIDSRLGQTSRNIVELFNEINGFNQLEKILILFDEFDALALDRLNSRDLREMGRVTSELLKCLDRLNEDVVLVATSNLYCHFDKALIRRFDSVIDFDRYSKEDLIDIAEAIYKENINRMKFEKTNIRLFRKILRSADSLPMPGTLRNTIRTALAFSDPSNECEAMQRLYKEFCSVSINLQTLKSQGFTIREIEILTNTSKSSVSRKLKEVLKS